MRGGSFDREASPQENREASPQENRKPAPAPSSAPAPKPTSPSYPSSQPSYPSREYTPSRPIYINPEIEIEIGDDDDDEYPYRQQNPYPQQNPAPYIPGGTPVQPVPSSNSAAPGQSPTNSTTVPNSSTAPASTISTEAEEDGFPWGFVVFLLVVGVGVFLLWYLLSQRGKRSAAPGSAAELANDTVTVTQLQVALLAEARDIQAELTDLGLEADLDTPEGLSEFLQETALALLRKPEYWSHVRSVSQTVGNREAAKRLFEQISIAERSKFGVESFSRVNDRVRDRSISVSPDRDPAEYIVVTLLVATEDDRPLFDPVYSAEDLKHALETLAAIPPSYLAVFELLWSPQVSTDSLSYDELLTQYADMMPIG
ncbi:MAG: DUF1517 domain-containing protein [Cyanobacteria bacterium J055]|nr:MAG: DUF1517 domain-containing protein [Cyanobacteria bacterium J055]